MNEEQNVRVYINSSFHLAQKYSRIFVPEKLNSIPRVQTVSFEAQTMSKDKDPSMFLRQMEAIVFIILQTFFAMHAVLKIGEYSRDIPQF